MVCTPSSNTINPPNLGPAPDIGFGPIYSPPQIPFSDLSLPENIPSDIIGFMQTVFAKLPAGVTILPNPDGSFDEIYDFISSVLNALSPFLAFYSFIQALLNMVLCIIDVICSLLRPFATIAAIIRLFKRCIPDFLAMFPWIALVIMILSLVYLLIQLIIYLINTVTALINDIVDNIVALSEAFQVGNEEGIVAITQKIASLLCLVEQVFALLIGFQALFAIVEALITSSARKPCKRKNGDDEASPCCDEEYCPDWIGDNPDGTFGVDGRLIYHKEVETVLDGFSNISLPPQRLERWQFVDDGNPEYPFNLIITPINDSIYWPQPLTFTDETSVKNAPYTVDMTMIINPATWGHDDTDGIRSIVIKDAIVRAQPYDGVLNYEGDLEYDPPFGNNNGTLQLVGGLVYEADGVAPYLINGVQGTLETFIHEDPTSTIPNSEDARQVYYIHYNMKINHEALMKYQLITAGCIPDIQTEVEIVDSTTPDVPLSDLVDSMPDVAGALECVDSALSTFRDDINLESAAVFQSAVVGCLNDLKEDAEDIFCKAFNAGASPYNSTFSLDPEVQFITAPINVSTIIRDFGGNNISTNVPESCREDIEDKIKGHVTLGEITGFTYDGYGSFVAHITSDRAGEGELQVSYDNNMISEIINRDEDDVPTEIQILTLPYEFVGTQSIDPLARRDESDIGGE